LDDEADDSRSFDQCGFSNDTSLGAGEEGEVASRFIVVPDGRRMRWLPGVVGDTDDRDVRFLEELVSLLVSHCEFGHSDSPFNAIRNVVIGNY